VAHRFFCRKLALGSRSQEVNDRSGRRICDDLTDASTLAWRCSANLYTGTRQSEVWIMRNDRNSLGRRAIAAICAAGLYSIASLVTSASAQAQSGAEGRIAFDVTSSNPKQLLTILDVIDETRQSMIKQGVKPQFVVAFRGPATKLVQSDLGQMKPEDQETARKIAEKLKVLRGASGIESVELCGIAVRLAGVKPENVLQDVRIVENSWVTSAGYQAKGYAYITP
jgi:intracellular sulfur oxidation DsrE/DsrF family protein